MIDKTRCFIRLTIDRVRMSAELLSELALVDEVQVVGNGVVGLAEHLDTGTLKVVAWGEAARCTTAEGDACGTDCRKCLEGVDDSGLDGARWGAGEVKGELDLPAVLGRELSEDDEASNLTLLGKSVVVLPVRHILPRVHVCEMDLLALGLPAVQPVGDALVDLGFQLFRELGADRNVMNLDALLLRVTDLALHVGVLKALDVVRVQALLGCDRECAPIELGGKHLLCRTATKQPQRFNLAFFLDVTQVARDGLGVLTVMAKRVANCHCESFMLNETNGRTGRGITPVLEFGLEPGRVGCIAVVCNQVLDGLEVHLCHNTVSSGPWRVERAGFGVPELGYRFPLRKRARVSGEESGVSDVAELQHKHENALHANTSTSVGWRSPLETVHVLFHCARVHLEALHLLDQCVRVMNTLATGKDLLAANENVEGVGHLRVVRVGHGVEGSCRGGEGPHLRAEGCRGRLSSRSR
jgi:hypothetical protein